MGSTSMPSTSVLRTTERTSRSRSTSSWYSDGSPSSGRTLRLADSAPCGSKSTSRTLRPYSASAAPRFIVVVVLPTPPFWLHRAMTRAGPCEASTGGTPKSGSGRPVGPQAVRRVARDGVGGGGHGHDPSPTGPGRLRPPRRRSPATGAAGRAGGARSGAGAGVAGRVDLAQRVDGDVRVHLRRRHRRVPEQLLDHPDVGPALEQVGGEGVTEQVRAHRWPARLGQPRGLGGALEHAQRLDCRLRRPPRELRNSARGSAGGPQQGRPAADQVGLQRGAGVAADGDLALLVPLAGEPQDRDQGAVGADDVVDVEPDGLGDPGPRGVDPLEQGAVAQPQRGARVRARRAGDRPRPRPSPWAGGGAVGRADLAGDVDVDQALGHPEPDQPADGGQRAGRGRGGQGHGAGGGAAQPDDEGGDVRLGHLARVGAPGLLPGGRPSGPRRGGRRRGC